MSIFSKVTFGVLGAATIAIAAGAAYYFLKPEERDDEVPQFPEDHPTAVTPEEPSVDIESPEVDTVVTEADTQVTEEPTTIPEETTVTEEPAVEETKDTEKA